MENEKQNTSMSNDLSGNVLRASERISTNASDFETAVVSKKESQNSEAVSTNCLPAETSNCDFTMNVVEVLRGSDMTNSAETMTIEAPGTAAGDLVVLEPKKDNVKGNVAQSSGPPNEESNTNCCLPAEVLDTEVLNSQTENQTKEENAKAIEVASGASEDLSQSKIKIEPTYENDSKIQNENITESFASVRVKAEKTLVGTKNFVTKSSLGLIAQYDSDSDQYENETVCDDDVTEVPLEANIDYRSKVVEIDSESDSSSSSDSDIEYITKMRKKIEKTIDLEEEDDAEDDEDDEATGKPKKKKTQNSMRVKGELTLDELPPIQDLHITVPEEECIVLGSIHSIIDQLLLVSALPDSSLYDLDTVLFLDKGKKVLGTIFDVLGQVADPLYCVRFNSHKDIGEKGLKVGDAVYVAPKTEHTQFVILSSLMKIRGSDASWENDVEPPPRYLDYSDDEQEREARQRIRHKDRSANREKDENEDDASKRARDADDETASVTSSISNKSQQPRYSHNKRGSYHNSEGFNRSDQNIQRPHHNVQRNAQYNSHGKFTQRNPNAGSWHSNYRRPYTYNQSPMPMPPMPLPMQMPNSMPPPYQLFPPYPQFSPTIAPPSMQTMSPMYAPNPYTVRPPYLSPQAPSHSTRMPRRSPSPPPPGIE